MATEHDDKDNLQTLRYTFAEDMAIINYITTDQRYLNSSGIKVWKEAENMQICPGRPYLSLKERYRKVIVKNLKKYNVDAELALKLIQFSRASSEDMTDESNLVWRTNGLTNGKTEGEIGKRKKLTEGEKKAFEHYRCGVKIEETMHNCFAILLATFACDFFASGSASILPPSFPKYDVAKKEIHLKHGKLHPHNAKADDDEHLVYKYRWLGDDIVKKEEDFQGEIDEEYSDEKKIKLPGGCEITEDQYLELESFKKETYYVKKCYCEQGGVYCQLRKALFKGNLI